MFRRQPKLELSIFLSAGGDTPYRIRPFVEMLIALDEITSRLRGVLDIQIYDNIFLRRVDLNKIHRTLKLSNLPKKEISEEHQHKLHVRQIVLIILFSSDFRFSPPRTPDGSHCKFSQLIWEFRLLGEFLVEAPKQRRYPFCIDFSNGDRASKLFY